MTCLIINKRSWHHVYPMTNLFPENSFFFVVSFPDFTLFPCQTSIFAGGFWDTILICHYIQTQNSKESQQKLEAIQNVPEVENMAFVAHEKVGPIVPIQELMSAIVNMAKCFIAFGLLAQPVSTELPILDNLKDDKKNQSQMQELNVLHTAYHHELGTALRNLCFDFFRTDWTSDIFKTNFYCLGKIGVQDGETICGDNIFPVVGNFCGQSRVNFWLLV